MKQQITMQQLKEIKGKAWKNLLDYCTENGKSSVLLTFGDMVEFLVRHKDYVFLGNLEQNNPEEWTDLLWHFVKCELKK